jgi:hypothetical protein
LCLAVLGSNDYLLRFCPLHDDQDDQQLFTAQIRCTGDWQQALRCPTPSHHAATSIAADTFVAHVRCSAWNPFVIKQDGNPAAEGIRIDKDVIDKDGHLVTHWQLGTLKQGAQYFPNHHEMWFPRVLLGATYRRSGPRPAATFVKLCGNKRAGKTILANMALYTGNYSELGEKLRYVYDNHYIYLPPVFTQTIPSDLFLQAVYPLDRMENYGDQPAVLPLATADTPFNLKVVFLRRQKESTSDDEPQVDGAGDRNALEIFGGEVLSHFPRPASIPNLDDADMFTVVFFDTAGETSVRADLSRNTWLDQHADVIAVLVDAKHFRRFRADAPAERPESEASSSIPVACKALTKIVNSNARVCLVVTKTDDISDENVKKEILSVQQAAGPRTKDERRLLTEILQGDRDGDGHQHERTLLNLVQNPKRVHRVFFVSTENLGKPGKLPRTDGLLGFMRWCVDGAPKGEERRPVDGFVLKRSG